MILKLKTIFSQFSPDLLFLMPITLTSIFLNLSWVFFSKNTKWLPSRIYLIFNTFFQTVVNTMFQQTNPKTAPWMPSFTSVFVLMFSVKVLGLLPYAFTSTSHMSLTYSMGVPLWMSVKMLGFYLAFKSRLSHLVPQGTPPFLIPLMVMMETLSLFAQPMALGLRLAANLTAGHLLMFLLSTAMWLLSTSPSMAMITLMMFFLLFLLEVGVACIQAYVFTALVHFYLSQNL